MRGALHFVPYASRRPILTPPHFVPKLLLTHQTAGGAAHLYTRPKMAPSTIDSRPASTVIRQYQLLQSIKRDLIKQGLLTGNATPAQVLDAVRTLTPPDLFQK